MSLHFIFTLTDSTLEDMFAHHVYVCQDPLRKMDTFHYSYLSVKAINTNIAYATDWYWF